MLRAFYPTTTKDDATLCRWPPYRPAARMWLFIGLLLSALAGCSSNKTQTINEGYVQAVTGLNNGLAQHVDDAARRDSAMSALQQADSLIREAVARRGDATKTFSETNADFDATQEDLIAIVNANQSANSSDLETLIELIATFQSSLTSEELIALYPERAEFAAQTLMLLDGS